MFSSLAVPLAVPAAAHAATSASWYSGSSVGAGYLDVPWTSGPNPRDPSGKAHIYTQYAVGDDINLATTPGGSNADYCTLYQTHSPGWGPDSNNQGGATGFTPNTPYSDWQEWDGNWTTCQAQGTTWGTRLQGTSNNADCPNVCGMHHFASAAGDGGRDLPWNAAAFGNHPSFVAYAHDDPWTAYSGGGSAGAWGYLCPLFKDQNSGEVIEYCIQEWTWGNRATQLDKASCNPYGVAPDSVGTDFSANRRYVTIRMGSDNDFTFNGSNGGSRTYIATISKQNMKNAITDVNSTCGRHASTDPGTWAYIGTEQGEEAYGLNEVGSSSSNLNLKTATDTLYANETLSAGDQITSANGSYRATMQSDGNFVVYSGSTALWSTGTYGHSGAYVKMQSDGNLVVYSSGNQPLWASGTNGQGSDDDLIMRSDGYLAIYNGTSGIWFDTD